MKGFNNCGFNSIVLLKASAKPPTFDAAKIGTKSTAKNINIPWKKSVQHTAINPPRKVYTTTTITPITKAVKYGKPKTILKSFAPETKADAV